MIDTDDIRASVSAGILSEKQAASLTALAHSRRGARENLAVGDEPFELFKGFNEIFIMVGLIILGVGWFAVIGWSVAGNLSTWQSTLIMMSALSAGLIWLLSEYFIRRRRMVGPAILLSIAFACVCAFGLSNQFAQIFMVAQEDFSSLILPGLLTIGAIVIYWIRFRVPFAMALIALGAFAVALLIAATRSGTPQSFTDVFTFSGEGGFAWTTLAVGLAVFALAMVFDGSDPHRVTRRSAQGFWLHVVAAPAIINTVALSILSSEIGGSNVILLIVMALFAIIAIVIDRRSFLLAAVGYVVAVVSTLAPIAEDVNFGYLILGLGIFLLLLGSFWERIRAALLTILPIGGLRRFLPPAH